MIKYILFDLDGTLTDPAEGITNSICYALDKFGIKVQDKASLYKFIGPPLYDSFVKYYGFSSENANKAVDYYREYFAPKGLYENTVYPGVTQLLQELTSYDVGLLVATSKPEVYAKKIIEHFDLQQYFYDVVGATLDATRNTKDAVIAYAINKHSIDAQSALMVGDRHHDVFGASQNSLRCVGVTYGFGSYSELSDAGADIIVDSVEQLKNTLINYISSKR